jgi:single-stranded DNA-binding protein
MKGTGTSVTIWGRVGAIRPVGKIAIFSVGVHTKKDDVETTEWHRVKVLREKQAQTAARNVKAGMLVVVTGELRREMFKDAKTGEARVSWQIYAHNVDIVNWGKDEAK